mgnify:CR=1 FL=1
MPEPEQEPRRRALHELFHPRWSRGQAVAAVHTHAQALRLPTIEEAEDIAFYERSFFSDITVRAYASGFPPPELPRVPSGRGFESARRGRASCSSPRAT